MKDKGQSETKKKSGRRQIEQWITEYVTSHKYTGHEVY